MPAGLKMRALDEDQPREGEGSSGGHGRREGEAKQRMGEKRIDGVGGTSQ